MPYSLSIDYFGERVVDGKVSGVVERGRPFFVIGWAADPQRGLVPRATYGLLDGTAQYRGNVCVRRDVGEHFGNEALEGSGFDIGFDTGLLSDGRHTLKLLLEEVDGTLVDVGTHVFTVVPPAPQNQSLVPRIIIAASPKSGSNYTRNILARYFGTEDPPPGEQGADYALDYLFLERARGRRFILSTHIKPFLYNILAARAEGITIVATWRNLGDTLVSFDDHVRNKLITGPNVVFHHDRAAYSAMPEQDRYQFLVTYALPWFVSFYVGFKESGVRFARYEEMAADATPHFTAIIEEVAGSVDRDHLAEVIAAPMSERLSNINVGKNYRSLEKLSSETKEMIEVALRRHYKPLDELIDELPWRRNDLT